MASCKIYSLFKKGDRVLACNYGPVSLTCVPCKLLEHIVCSNIMAHLDEYQLLSDRQHAFRKMHSCETQLTTVINDRVKISDKGGQVDTFILDFENAFYTRLENFLKANYLVKALVERHSGGWVPFFAREHNELLQTVKLRSGLQFCQVSHKGTFLVHYCSLCT